MTCNLCNKAFLNKASLVNHIKFCDGSGLMSRSKKRKSINHTCPKCKQDIKSSIQKHIKVCSGLGPRRAQIGKLSIEERNKKVSLGLIKKYEDKLYKNKIIQHLKSTNHSHPKTRVDDKRGGSRMGGGRGKHGYYKEFWCDSSWEMAFIVYCLDRDIKIERNCKGHKYCYNNQWFTFYPDFLVEDKYVEIKGYIDDKASAKLKQFKENITLIGEKEIKPYLEYTRQKLGINWKDKYLS